VSRVSQTLDRIHATFDDDNLVANAGLLLPATLVERLGVEAVINTTLRLDGRVGGASPGRKVLTLLNTMLAGGSHIDHADMLRAGASELVVSHRVMAPSTLGTFLRSFTFGHVRQLEAVNDIVMQRAWAAGTAPGALVIDVDSTICEVVGKAKQGAGFGYTHVLGYHPLLATIAGSGEILHGRLRKGSANTQRGTKRFVNELVARARRDDPKRKLTVRFDSGFWNNDTMLNLTRLDVRYTMAVRTNVKAVQATIAGIDETAWQPIDYTCDGEAQVAECDYTSGQGAKRVTRRLVVRRTRLTGKTQQKLWPDWRHHAFLTDLDGNVIEVDRFHREHATVELAIKDLKAGAGLEHLPSGVFWANSAWFQIAILAHNMMRWTARLGGHDTDRLIVARTIRTRLLALPGRLVNRAGQPTLRLPARWPWANTFNTILDALRSLEPVPT
jgi:Transposase DDE domain group 1